MADWVGFTDEELKRLKGTDGAQRGRSSGRQAPPRGSPSQRGKPLRQKQLGQKLPSPEPVSSDVQPSMLLSPKKPKGTPSPINDELPAKLDAQAEETPSKEAVDEAAGKAEVKPERVLGKELDEKEFIQREMSNADKFQLQQKIMEEQNKKKQELLAMAIVERQKKAKAESNKLVRIQSELATLDRILHADVTIIRDKIEEASREFLEAQKRYNRAEQEFIEAKMDLHTKSETKDSLTEHLYTIIHQNEIRKAKKLTELMEKLQLETNEETSPVKIDLSGLPSLTLLNAIHSLEADEPVSPPIDATVRVSDSPKNKIAESSQGETTTKEDTSENLDLSLPLCSNQSLEATVPFEKISSAEKESNPTSHEISMDESKNEVCLDQNEIHACNQEKS